MLLVTYTFVYIFLNLTNVKRHSIYCYHNKKRKNQGKPPSSRETPSRKIIGLILSIELFNFGLDQDIEGSNTKNDTKGKIEQVGGTNDHSANTTINEETIVQKFQKSSFLQCG
ncbi:MAG: hypothetical protein ACFFB5_13600 [Promethearchaeota archaeon]